MEITKLSTRGQIVIPEILREGFTEGTAFNITRKGDLIVLKKIKGFSEKEIKEMEELDKIWKEIDNGECKTLSKEDFIKDMGSW